MACSGYGLLLLDNYGTSWLLDMFSVVFHTQLYILDMTGMEKKMRLFEEQERQFLDFAKQFKYEPVDSSAPLTAKGGLYRIVMAPCVYIKHKYRSWVQAFAILGSNSEYKRIAWFQLLRLRGSAE